MDWRGYSTAGSRGGLIPITWTDALSPPHLALSQWRCAGIHPLSSGGTSDERGALWKYDDAANTEMGSVAFVADAEDTCSSFNMWI